jgi:GH24 family phage-related lysozyme (muramidase)
MEQKISDLGVNLIKHYEQLNDGDLQAIGLQPKPDVSGYMTIGYGRVLIRPQGGYIKTIADVAKYFPQYLTIDEPQAAQYLKEDCDRFEDSINSLDLQLSQGQFDALVSFAFNVGFGALKGSTLLKRIKGIVSTPSIEVCFGMWNKSAGVAYRGLTFRRQSESLLYSTGVLKFFN